VMTPSDWLNLLGSFQDKQPEYDEINNNNRDNIVPFVEHIADKFANMVDQMSLTEQSRNEYRRVFRDWCECIMEKPVPAVQTRPKLDSQILKDYIFDLNAIEREFNNLRYFQESSQDTRTIMYSLVNLDIPYRYKRILDERKYEENKNLLNEYISCSAENACSRWL